MVEVHVCSEANVQCPIHWCALGELHLHTGENPQSMQHYLELEPRVNATESGSPCTC